VFKEHNHEALLTTLGDKVVRPSKLVAMELKKKQELFGDLNEFETAALAKAEAAHEKLLAQLK